MKLNKDILKKFHVLFEKVNEAVEEPKLEFMAEGVLEGGTKIYTTAEAWGEGVDIYVVNEEGEEVPVPVGEYALEDGTMIIVEEAGVVARIDAKKEEEEEEKEQQYEEETSEEVEQSEDYSKEDVLNLIEAAVSKLRTEFSSELEAKDQEIERLKAEFGKELPKAPVVKQPKPLSEIAKETNPTKRALAFYNNYQ
jgi:hypothetical protein